MNNTFNDEYENESFDPIKLFHFSTLFDNYKVENILKGEKSLNDSGIKDISTSFLGNKTKRDEIDLEEYQIKMGEIKTFKNVEIKKDDSTNEFYKIIKKKRGRKKTTEINKGIHTKDSDDNKMVKIKTYFSNSFQKFINKILRIVKFDKLDTVLGENLKKDYNLELWDKSLKDIYLETNISSIYSTTNPKNNREIINKIYKEKNKEIITIMDLSYGEVFEIFIKDIKPMNLKLFQKVKDSKILDNSLFSTIKNFLNKIKEQEEKNGESEEFIEKYIKDIIRLCLNFKYWFTSKKARQRKKKI